MCVPVRAFVCAFAGVCVCVCVLCVWVCVCLGVCVCVGVIVSVHGHTHACVSVRKSYLASHSPSRVKNESHKGAGFMPQSVHLNNVNFVRKYAGIQKTAIKRTQSGY